MCAHPRSQKPHERSQAGPRHERVHGSVESLDGSEVVRVAPLGETWSLRIGAVRRLWDSPRARIGSTAARLLDDDMSACDLITVMSPLRDGAVTSMSPSGPTQTRGLPFREPVVTDWCT